MFASEERPVISVVSKLHRWGVAIDQVLITETWIDQPSAMEWIAEHYPDHVKVSIIDRHIIGEWKVAFQLRHMFDDVEIEEGRVKATHPAGGVIFKQTKKIKQTDGTIVVQYQCMDRDQAFLNAIALGIKGYQKDDRHYRFSLVRRNNHSGWNYYPLPLLFASRHERISTANDMGVRIPNERWIRRRRSDVSNLLLDRAALNQIDYNTLVITHGVQQERG